MIENTDRHQTKPIPISWCFTVHMPNLIAIHEAIFEITWNCLYIYTDGTHIPLFHTYAFVYLLTCFCE